MSSILNWWDFFLFILFSGINLVVWLCIRKQLPTKNQTSDLQERQFAASTINGASTTGITAVSILIPASFIILQLGFGPKPLPHDALANVFRASLWFLLSLGLGLYTIFSVAMSSQSRNVAKYFPIGVVFAPQLIALAVGGVRLLVGIIIIFSSH